MIVVAGPVETEATFALIERTFAAWEPIGGTAPRYEASLIPDGPRLLFVDRAADHAQLFFAIPYRIASDEDVCEYMAEGDLRAVARGLIDAALEGGGPDNITVVVAEGIEADVP